MLHLTWFGWLYVMWFMLGMLMLVWSIGQPVRRPMTGERAVIILIIDGFLLWGLVTVGTVK
jgi:hypothetical protein